MSSSLGLESGTVRVAPYDPAWPSLFDAAAAGIRAALRDLPLSLDHVGSTAVPGLPAKPIIDILAGRPVGSPVGPYVDALERAGYEHRGEQGVAGRAFFRRGTPRAYHVHLFEVGTAPWRHHLAFRDALRADPALRTEYAALKAMLAERHPRDREAYTSGKEPFIRRVLDERAPRAADAFLLGQLDTAWQLASYHLDGLTTEECLWRPARTGPHVHRAPDGRWRASWPEHERYDLGPPSIAWLTWHVGFWWSMALDHSFGGGTLTREAVTWPGDADGVRAWIGQLHAEWQAAVERLTAGDLRSAERTRWPFRNRPFGDVVAWANVELAKNAAEIGYARFLYGAREV